MKYLLVFILILSLNKAQAKVQFTEYQTINYSNTNIKDGWYSATVIYTNYSTNYKAKYTLKVKIQSNQVTTIEFEDGTLHSGYNNSGYNWSGGALDITKNSAGEITSASATVKIIGKDSSTKIFNISIS